MQCSRKLNIKILIISIWFAAPIFLEPLAAAYIIYNVKIYPDPRLINDVMFSFLPYEPFAYTYYATILLAITFIPCLLYAFKNEDFRSNAFVTIGTVFLFRDISITLTNLPLTLHDLNDPRCIRYSKLTFNEILAHTYLGYECADYFFSGHMLFFTLGFIATYNLLGKYSLIFLIPLYLTCILALLLSRVHYSIDIIHSIFITTMVYNFLTPLMLNKLDQLIEQNILPN